MRRVGEIPMGVEDNELGKNPVRFEGWRFRWVKGASQPQRSRAVVRSQRWSVIHHRHVRYLQGLLPVNMMTSAGAFRCLRCPVASQNLSGGFGSARDSAVVACARGATRSRYDGQTISLTDGRPKKQLRTSVSTLRRGKNVINPA